MNLDTIQQSMTSSILDSSTNNQFKTNFDKYSDDELNARLQIYRNNFFKSLIENCKDLYPTIVKMVGEEFFEATAKYYLSTNPPSSAAMVEFGFDFPEFLRNFQHTQEYGYLPGIAEIDLARHQAYHSKDDIPLEADFFAQCDIEQLAQSYASLHSSMHLISSDYAIYSLWNFTQEDDENGSSVDADCAEHVMILRPHNDVLMHELDLGTLTFFQQLENQLTVGEALESGLEQDNEFNPTEAINLMIQSGTVINLITGEN